MIYPTLRLTDVEGFVEYFDTTTQDNPYISISLPTREEATEMWFDMFTSFLEQFWRGYDQGYADALEDEGYEEDEEGGDIRWM